MSQEWTKEEYEYLSELYRNGEITKGLVRSAGARKMPVEDENGQLVTKDVNGILLQLDFGLQAFCPANEFDDREYKSLVGFVGTYQECIITNLKLDNEKSESMAIVSVKRAAEIKRKAFWEEIETLEKNGELQDKVFEGVVTGTNPRTQRIYVRVNGQDCFMGIRDWDHSYSFIELIRRNTRTPVKVRRFNKETGQVQVSRKDAVPDPFHDLVEYQEDDAVVGRVVRVDPINGIFVQLDKGVVVKAGKPSYLPKPIVDDVVSVRVQEVDLEKRRARVVIINYVEKKERKDAASFLYV